MQKLKKRKSVIPIEDVNTIKLLRQNLKSKPRDLLLFDLITQTGIKVKHLISLKVKHLISINIGERIPVPNGGDPSSSSPIMNQTIYLSFQSYVEKERPQDDDYLFKSRKRPEPLSLTSVSHLVRKWFNQANLKDFSGISSLRKTWEFHNRNHNRPAANWVISERPKHILKPIETGTLKGAVYRELKQAILSGHIQPGERLFTEKVAQQTKVSETPAREALAKLQAEGFISKESRKGYVVKELSCKDLLEIYKIRLVLETMATKVAITKMSESVVSHLEDLLQRHEQAGIQNDVEKYTMFNKKFHHLIYFTADMPTLYMIISLLWNRMIPYLNLLIRECGDYDIIFPLRCHRGMLEAIKHRDVDEACRWLRADLNRGGKILTQWFDEKKGKKE